MEQARRDLQDVIHDVDDTILTLFTDAWRDVEAEFPKVFATLFPGGAGRLVLTGPMTCSPPALKLKRGWQESQEAFAAFRWRKITHGTGYVGGDLPGAASPFYVMDEVEAALDDVNLRRLIALFEELRNDSQLIVITHQKPTMDVANVLYGVTMRGDGVTRVISQRMSPATSS